MKKCYQSHPAIEMNFNGTTAKIYGGNGFAPAKKADIYIDLNPRKNVPTFKPIGSSDGGIYYNFPIINMGVPNLQKLNELLNFIEDNATLGFSFHIGCIGGHGRTGLVLAALWHRLTADRNAIAHIRKVYCEKAVESQQQIDYLVKNFDQEPIKPRYTKNDLNKWQI